MRIPSTLSRRLIAASAACFLLALASSGCAPDAEDQRDGEPLVPPAPVPAGPAARLRLDWDAHDPPHWPAAGVLAEVSGAIYASPDSAADTLDDLGFDVVERFSFESTAGAVLTSGGVTVVAFRGTDDRYDWLANLDARTVTTSHGDMHRGFDRTYRAVGDDVRRAVRIAEPGHLWITGHSLGGALAVVCALDLLDEGYELDGVVTFGQPMVGRADLAEHLDRELDRKFVRFMNESDLVPRVPPHFTHAGSLVWFTGGAIMRTYPRPFAVGDAYSTLGEPADAVSEPPPLSDAEFRTLQADLRAADASAETLPDGRVPVGGNSRFVRDHGMDLYLDRVRAEVGK